MNIKKTSVVTLECAIAIAIIGLFFIPGQPLFVATLCIFVLIFGAFLSNASENVFILFFLITFFTFLLGRPIAENIFGKFDAGTKQLSDEASTVMYVCLMVSMLGLTLGYKFPRFVTNSSTVLNKRKIIFPISNSDCYKVTMRKTAKILSIILYCFVAVENYDRLAYVMIVGYTESFATYSSTVPSIVHMLAEEAPLAFALYLATLPSKKDTRIPVAVFMLAMIIKMVTGYRYEIVAGVLLLILYYIMRERMDENEKWIHRSSLIIFILLIPIAVIGLQFMTSIRAGKEIVWTSDSNPIVNFLYGVGGSSSLIGYVYMNKEALSGHSFFYSFGRVWDAIAGNFFLKNLTGVTVYATQTVEKATLGNSLGDALTYIMYPSRYLAGYGMGSCYIAELFYDFSYIGVFIGNFIIGKIIKNIKAISANDYVRNFLCIFMITMLFRISRDTADYFIVEFVGIKNIAFVIAINCFVVMIMKRKETLGGIS